MINLTKTMTHYFSLSFNQDGEARTEAFIVKQRDNGLNLAIVHANNIGQTNADKQAVRKLLLNTSDQQKWDNFVASANGIDNVTLIKR